MVLVWTANDPPLMTSPTARNFVPGRGASGQIEYEAGFARCRVLAPPLITRGGRKNPERTSGQGIRRYFEPEG
jgi:hypothetical protein